MIITLHYHIIIRDKLTSFLKNHEELIGLDLLYFIKNGFYLLVTHFSIMSLGFIVFLFMARIWDKVTFGKWQLVFSVVNTLLFFSLTGMNNSIARSIVLNKERSFIDCVRTRLKWSLLGSAGLLLTAGYFYFKGDYLLAYSFLSLCFIFPFYSSFDSVFFFYEAKKKFFQSSILRISLKTIIALILLLLLFFYNSFILITVVNFLIPALFCLIVYSQIKSQLNKEKDENSVNFGKKLSFINVVSTITAYADKIILAFFLGVEQLAIYSIALTFPDLFNGFIKQLHSLVFPKLTKITKKELLSKIFEKWYITLLVPLLITFFSIFLSYLIPLIYGSKYIDSINLSILMSASLIVLFINPVVTNFLIINKLSQIIFKTQLISSLIRLALLLFFSKTLGVFGVALVYTIHNSVITLLNILFISKMR